MRKKSIWLICLIVIMAFLVSACGGGQKQQTDNSGGQEVQFPTKPVTLIVPYGAGGGTDVTARLLAEPLGKYLGQPVVVINVTGGGGWNGWGQLAQSDKDGYTIGYVNIPNVFAGYLDPAMNRSETIDSFTMIMNHVTDPGLYAVRPDSPFKTMQDLIDYAKENPGKVSITAHGSGGDEYLGIKQLEQFAGTEFTMIHNDSTAESIAQVLGGHVDVLGANVSEVTSLVENGEIVVLGLAYDERSKFLPDVPTLKEQGIDAVHFAARGLAVPAGTPDEIVEILANALEQAVNDSEHIQKCDELGLSLISMKGQEYTDFIKFWEAKVKDLMGW
ncbi:tripartite tricarboxylate transporter substrate binding protein [Desulfitibacter alkalitolerans]|uniref:tripartite tricarboxylate transporter substrate binding protein n=1 Tax=Desulfitibacter alkalitolerans TaxID=264641 RepID=UPI0006858966|nr:tripartite tricarboxylate transporter substrate binding protein [Desulfitibacter alkalitolerans]